MMDSPESSAGRGTLHVQAVWEAPVLPSWRWQQAERILCQMGEQQVQSKRLLFIYSVSKHSFVTSDFRTFFGSFARARQSELSATLKGTTARSGLARPSSGNSSAFGSRCHLLCSLHGAFQFIGSGQSEHDENGGLAAAGSFRRCQGADEAPSTAMAR